MSAKKYNTIDLFAGIGGIRIGFERAGFQTVYANDFDSYCKITYDNYFDSVPLHVADLKEVAKNAKTLPAFNILLGGFPCQAFSVAGYRKGFEDAGRGDLFFDVADIIAERKPQVVFLENVKNLKTHDNKRTFRIITETLEGLGYHVTSKVLNSMEYGNVPQNRERIYIVAFKLKKHYENFAFPEKVPLKKHVKSLLKKTVAEKYYYDGTNLYSKLVPHVTSDDTVYQWRRQYVRENKKGVCPTLTANMGTGGHNVPIIKNHKGIRKLTPQECALIQGFPRDFVFPVELADSRQYKQIGNSVTVTVIERIAQQIRNAIDS